MNVFVPLRSLTLFAEALSVTLFVALALSVLVVTTNRLHGRFSMDHPGTVQKFHVNPTPRIGGFGIYFSLVVAWYVLKPSEARSILLSCSGLPKT
jgi:UDP-N-acetylmuramyl pentapeptide phosphotransferase/UDP-N-acetylglucosamine-1-phosphate transferase